MLDKLLHAYDAHNRISYRLEMEDVLFPIGISIPLALIVNELATNSIKHAFFPGSEGPDSNPSPGILPQCRRIRCRG